MSQLKPNYDELAFFNRQLAAMLREGVPLEGAIKQLAAGMKGGQFRDEMLKLETELRQGQPAREALRRTALPSFYTAMVEIGLKSNDLPGILTLLADYYQRVNSLFARLKGLMVYPTIVILVSLGLTIGLTLLLNRTIQSLASQWVPTQSLAALVWFSPIVLGLIAVAMLAAIGVPALRNWLRWRLPGFREASLARLAAAISLMVRNGASLPDALLLAEALEPDTVAGKEMARWRQQIGLGNGNPSQWGAATYPFPPLFMWLVRGSGEDVAAGFQKASEIYESRASYRIEMALYGALPVSIVLLGQVVFWEVAPLLQVLVQTMNMLGAIE